MSARSSEFCHQCVIYNLVVTKKGSKVDDLTKVQLSLTNCPARGSWNRKGGMRWWASESGQMNTHINTSNKIHNFFLHNAMWFLLLRNRYTIQLSIFTTVLVGSNVWKKHAFFFVQSIQRIYSTSSWDLQ